MSNGDVLIQFKALPARYDCCARSVENWLRAPDLGFPQPIFLRRRRYFRKSDLEAFEARFADRFGARVKAAPSRQSQARAVSADTRDRGSA
jgi:hypothetical protein